MASLQDITTSDTSTVELEPYSLISRDDDWAAMRFTQFEWAFGLKYRATPFDSEFNVITVPRDLIPLLKRQTLRLAPKKHVIEHAYDIMKHNRTAKVGERRKFEEFGKGPWEYVLFSGRFDHKTLRPKYLPPLFQRISDGKAESLNLDADYDNLPRITSMIHPAIAIFLLELQVPDPLYAPQSLKENIIFPMINIVGIWPSWSHNPFKPFPTSSSSSKRKRSRSELSDITCKCTLCAHSSESSSSFGTYASDFNSSDGEELIALLPAGEDAEDGKVDLDVTAWAGKVILPRAHSSDDDLDDNEDDELLRTYAQESALAPEQAKKALKEEDEKRNALAEPTLEELRCRLSKKRSRRR
ncbi:hypothetical protein Moror_16395 [Moniliophthora roreri MCA 2997]|uniref:Uncharacterized protein n=2 Tax=Moniliophthora roreri TaxID=221103 RepID=V2XB93_MONRO|nr:hypothetical protein Moror_16395 [Moniliophthora roreri MCA 2997]KAI3601450.1 hypothetical protein WG66_002566 [Moniliophthora roreri]